MHTYAHPDTKTFASHIGVCKKCGAPYTGFTMNADGKTRMTKCGHAPHVILQPNPLLPKEA